MQDKLAKWLQNALAAEFRHLHDRLDRISQRLEGRSDELLEKLSPNFPLGREVGYREFWNVQASNRRGAATGVVGRPFGVEGWNELIALHGEPVARMIAGALEIGSDHDVLEVGVGIGRLARHIAPRCRSFIGADIGANMLSDAERRWEPLRLPIRWHCLQAPGLGDFADASLDRVYFHVVLVHLDREDAFNSLRETARVLRSGGRAWFQFYNLLSPSGWRAFGETADAAWQAGGKSRGRMQFSTAAEVRHMVGAAGLRILEDRSHLLAHDQQYTELADPVEWREYRDRLEQVVRARLGDGPETAAAMAHFDANRLEGAPDRDWQGYLVAVAEKP